MLNINVMRAVTVEQSSMWSMAQHIALCAVFGSETFFLAALHSSQCSCETADEDCLFCSFALFKIEWSLSRDGDIEKLTTRLEQPHICIEKQLDGIDIAHRGQWMARWIISQSGLINGDINGVSVNVQLI